MNNTKTREKGPWKPSVFSQSSLLNESGDLMTADWILYFFILLCRNCSTLKVQQCEQTRRSKRDTKSSTTVHDSALKDAQMCHSVKMCLQPCADIFHISWIIFQAELYHNIEPVCTVTFLDTRQAFFPFSSSRL